MLSKRMTWILVGGLLFALATFVGMWWLSSRWMVSFDFVIPWAALCGVAGGISSWMYANFVQASSDRARVSDARRDKLADLAAEIMEKTHRVHRGILSIANPWIFNYELEQAQEKYKGEKGRKYDSQGIVLEYRYEEREEIFSEYWGLDIKANVYFGEEVSNIIKDLKNIIHSVRVNIQMINYFSESGTSGESGETDEVHKAKNFIRFLSDESIPLIGYQVDESTREKIEKFKSIPERIDKALSKYVREDQTTDQQQGPAENS